MTNWQQVKLCDVCDLIAGFAFKSKDFGDYPDKVIKITNIEPPFVNMTNLSGIDISKYDTNKLEKFIVQKGDYVLAMTGATIGKLGRVYSNLAYINQRVLLFKSNTKADKNFLYYILADYNFSQYVINHVDSESAQANISATTIGKYEFSLPPLEIQNKIAGVLGALDDKIELNNKINNNLEQQAQALFKSWFVDKTNPNRKNIKVEEFFNISIGKTPPRKEPEWFSKNSNDVKWISISDMGNCGMYISDSSEYLIPSAISKFNVKIVPNNTVLLSFKLTVGRIAITDGKMTTNEAIAHFITDKTEINEYLYCYLKNFNFQTMGSTSSIATAVNSKIIKAMPFVVPEENELKDFHCAVAPMFSQIKFNQRENFRLAQLRDTLLPKLMSGKIDVSKVDINELNAADMLL